MSPQPADWRRWNGPGHRKPAATGQGSRRAFGATWWGRAWVEALVDRAQLDANRLPRGRSYARSGAVGVLELSAGEVRASVQGSRGKPYSVRVRVRKFTDAEWDRVLGAVGAQVGHTAALLDGELPPEVVEDVSSAGLDLLPGAGELGPQCSCPDWADPCKHAAAVCFLVAEELDCDPFQLLLLRGRSREEVLAGLRAKRRSSSAQEQAYAGPILDEGVLARAAYDVVSLPALPALPLPPSRPGRPAVLPVDPPPGAPIDRAQVVALAADAAARAWELASGVSDGGLGLDEDADLARRAAVLLGTAEFTALARRVGLSARELTRWALAWREGGAGGLVALRVRWRPDPTALAAGRAALQGVGAAVHVAGNRLTAGDVQLRLGQDGQWYRFARRFGDWDLDRPPEPDPSLLVTRT
jgi:uncharacterized Zn finger protein